MRTSESNPQLEVDSSVPIVRPLIACERHRCCARHDLRQGADPIAVAALLEICVEDLYDALDYTPRPSA